MLRGGGATHLHVILCAHAEHEQIWMWSKVWLSWQYSQNHTATKATPLTTPKIVHIQIAASMWAVPVKTAVHIRRKSVQGRLKLLVV